jgi:thioredoxin-related protein
MANSFYEQRYRGWLWFEDEEKREIEKVEEEAARKKEQRREEVAKARAEVEEFSKELDDLKFMMIRYPTIENVLAYKKKEAEMFETAISVDQSYRMARLVDPDHADRLKNPMNLYGRKIQAKEEEKRIAEEVKELAREVELFIFTKSDCPYCTQLEPVLADFAKAYLFTVEAVSIDGKNSAYFKTNHDNELVHKLGVKQTPTIMLVTKDGEISFELFRGAASISELEQVSTLAIKYIKTLRKESNLSKHHDSELYTDKPYYDNRHDSEGHIRKTYSDESRAVSEYQAVEHDNSEHQGSEYHDSKRNVINHDVNKILKGYQ